MPSFNNIFKDLKKRKVFRSIAIYAGSSFIILQVCSIVFPALLLPEWSTRLVVVLLLIGLPILILFSWIYDITPEGDIIADSEKLFFNTNHTILMVILVIVIGVLFYFKDSFFKSTVNPKSVAVLPFNNYSPKAEDDYLSDGFTEVIIANLAKVQDLMVISRTSVMRYQDTDMSLKDIAEELNVANILEGSVQKKGNKIRVVSQLIEAQTDNHIWAETYDSEIDDIFTIQTNISKEIASSLKSRITGSEKSHIEDKLTDNIEAYEMYVKVKELRREDREWKIRKDLLHKIIDIDPNFAEAYALLSIEYSEKVHSGWDNTQAKKNKAKEFIDKAFNIKPESAEVRFAFGYYYYGCYKDYLRALEHYNYALSMEPGNANYNAFIGYVHRRLGNWNKTLQYLEKALKLDPNDISLSSNLFGTYLFLKKYEKVNLINQYKRAYRLNPEEGWVYAMGARFTFFLEGNTTNARKILSASSKLLPDYDYSEVISQLDIYDDKYESIFTLLDEQTDSIFFNQQEINPKSKIFGMIYWRMDEKEKAKNEFTKALNVVLNMQEYEGDPRYHSLLGMIYAFLNMPKEAVKESKMAQALAPPSKDAFLSDSFDLYLSAVYALNGEHDMALNMIEFF